MASLIYLDTHVVAWLYSEGERAWPAKSRDGLESSNDIRISPMVRLELQYLYEIERVTQPPMPVLDVIESTLGVTLCKAAFPAIVREAESQNWTRDPFDRLIVAQASVFNAPLMTKDETIHAHYARAVWE